jgi:hypothetical protein
MEFLETLVKATGNGGFDLSPAAVPAPAPAPVVPRRYLDPHSIRHAKLSKAVLAILGAEVMDGRVSLINPTLNMIAQGIGVSTSYLVAARKLSPEQRQEVLADKRPLVQPKPPAPVLNAEQRFAAVVAELGGVANALDRLTLIERNGSGHRNGNGA